MSITKKDFCGYNLFVVENKNAMKMSVTDFGATLTSVIFNDKNGKPVSVSYGSDDVEFYKKQFFGSTVGRFANRIRGGKFMLDGKEYSLQKNSGENHLHGGVGTFARKVFKSYISENNDSLSIIFTYLSVDGEEGYPGNLDVSVIYTLTDDNELIIEYKAVSDKNTIVNLTNHAYWNLNGGGSVREHLLKLDCPFYLDAYDDDSATGQVLKTEGSLYDFNESKPVGTNIDKVGGAFKGYDNSFLPSEKDITKPRAILHSEQSGITMQLFTDNPAVHLYTGNKLNNLQTREGVINQHDGLCLETQLLPCSPNYPHFASPVLRANELYNYKTIHKFSL